MRTRRPAPTPKFLGDVPGMKAFTVQQPNAHAIAHLGKTTENRGRATHYRGTVGVHAGLTWSEHGGSNPVIRRAWHEWAKTIPPLPTPDVPETGVPGSLRESNTLWMPRGAVIAVVDIVGCHEAVLTAAGVCCCAPWGDIEMYDPTVFHWELANVRRLRNPVPAVGRLYLWTLPPEVEAAVLTEVP